MKLKDVRKSCEALEDLELGGNTVSDFLGMIEQIRRLPAEARVAQSLVNCRVARRIGKTQFSAEESVIVSKTCYNSALNTLELFEEGKPPNLTEDFKKLTHDFNWQRRPKDTTYKKQTHLYLAASLLGYSWKIFPAYAFGVSEINWMYDNPEELETYSLKDKSVLKRDTPICKILRIATNQIISGVLWKDGEEADSLEDYLAWAGEAG